MNLTTPRELNLGTPGGGDAGTNSTEAGARDGQPADRTSSPSPDAAPGGDAGLPADVPDALVPGDASAPADLPRADAGCPATCTAELASTCGRAGGCDATGACRLHPAGTACAPASCIGSTESAARQCDGKGACAPAATRECAPYTCGASACRASCAATSECAGGFECAVGVCEGPALRWRFDETSGNMAMDSSGNGLHGSYSGTAGARPTTSSEVPMVRFADPASRAFDRTQRHQVRLNRMPANLMPTNNVTVTAWFRTRSIDASGYGLIVNGGDGYFMVLGQGVIWLGRGTAMNTAYCTANVGGFTDGQWHHLAGVVSTTGMKLFLDGIERCANGRSGTLVYDAGLGLLVGHRDLSEPQPFEGNIDEVRVYTRALTTTQIQALAQGGE